MAIPSCEPPQFSNGITEALQHSWCERRIGPDPFGELGGNVYFAVLQSRLEGWTVNRLSVSLAELLQNCPEVWFQSIRQKLLLEMSSGEGPASLGHKRGSKLAVRDRLHILLARLVAVKNREPGD